MRLNKYELFCVFDMLPYSSGILCEGLKTYSHVVLTRKIRFERHGNRGVTGSSTNAPGLVGVDAAAESLIRTPEKETTTQGLGTRLSDS